MTDPEQFFKLTPKISQKLREAKLTRVEMALWLYLIDLQPWQDASVTIKPSQVQKALEINRAAYHRAIAKLEQANLFEFTDKGKKITNKLGNTIKQPDACIKNDTNTTQKRIKNDTSCIKNDTPRIKNDTVCIKNDTNATLKPAHSNGSGNPLDPEDLEDQENSLSAFLNFRSEIERESFFKFWNKKADELPKPPTMRQAWLKKHWRDLWDEFTASRQGTDAKAAGRLECVNWRSQPGYPELLQLYNKTPGEFWDFTLPPEDLDYRKAFAKWVIANQIWDIDEELANWEGGYRG